MRLRALVLSAAALLLWAPGAHADGPADWPMDRHDPGNTGYNAGETTLRPPLRLRWSTPASTDRTSSTGIGSPVIAGGLVYVDIGGYVSAVDAATGVTKWSSNVRGELAPAVANGVLYVEGLNTLYALDAQTGALLRSDTLGCCIDSPAMAVNGVVYLGTRDGRVRALDGATGAVKWTFSVGQEIAHFSTPSLADGLLFLESQEANHIGKLYALDAGTGELKWTYGSLLWSGSSPVVVNGTVYFTDGNLTAGAVDAQTGDVKWLTHPGGVFLTAPAVADSTVFLSDHGGTIYALDTANGNTKWTHQLAWPTNSAMPAPIVADGLVYVPGVLGGLSAIVALDALTGQYQWSFAGAPDIISYMPDPYYTLFTQAAAADGALYTTSHGVLYALENDVSIPNLSVKNIAGRDKVHPGEPLSYLITLDNNGSTGATLSLTDTIPPGTSLIAGSLTAGAAYSPTIGSVLWSGIVPPNQSTDPPAVIGFRVGVSNSITETYLLNTVQISNGIITTTHRTTTPVWHRSYLPLTLKESTGW